MNERQTCWIARFDFEPEQLATVRWDDLRFHSFKFEHKRKLTDTCVYNAEVADDSRSDIVIISEPFSAQRLAELAAERFGDMVKAVVDINQRLLALGGGLHADEEAALLAQGSTQADLWGINIYPEKPRPEWVEFDSMINIRPRLGNRSRGVEDGAVQQLILEIVDSLIL